MPTTECTTQLTLFEVGTQAVTVDFAGGQVVTDAGLLAVRQLDLALGVIAEAADLLPDPRVQDRVTHSCERLLAQRVYQILAGHFDGNDAAWLRPGTVGAGCGAVDALREIVARLRGAWPDVPLFVRGDYGVSSPELHEFCDEQGIAFAVGYSINEVLKRRTRDDLARVEVCSWAWGEPCREFRVVDDYRAELWSKPRRVIAKAIDAYKEYLIAERRSSKTRTKYWQVFAIVLSLALTLRRNLISQVDVVFVDRYRANRAKVCAAKTVYTEVVILRQLVKFAASRKMVASDPLLGLRLKKPKPTPQPCFDDEQTAAILSHATPAHRPTFLLLAETGLRFGEAQWLTWDDVDFKRNVIHVRGKDAWKPKTGDERAVPMTPTLRDLLQKKPRLGRWVLTAAASKAHPTTDRQISERRSLQALQRILRKLGFPGKLHTFRHAFISRCLTKGIEESVVRSWVGHVDPAILRLYTHISSRISQERIRRLGDDTAPGGGPGGTTPAT